MANTRNSSVVSISGDKLFSHVSNFCIADKIPSKKASPIVYLDRWLYSRHACTMNDIIFAPQSYHCRLCLRMPPKHPALLIC